jgi:fimbrial chaperone protein
MMLVLNDFKAWEPIIFYTIYKLLTNKLKRNCFELLRFTQGGKILVRIEGLISRKVVKYWLENYQSMAANDSPIDALPHNSGRKSYDGFNDTKLNLIMLDAAIRDLPPVLSVCCKYRWIVQLPLKDTLKITGLSKSTYYRRCDKSVDFIYYHVNGSAAGINDLIMAIKLGKI